MLAPERGEKCSRSSVVRVRSLYLRCPWFKSNREYQLRRDGGRADAEDLKSSGAPRAGSNPAPGTIFRMRIHNGQGLGTVRVTETRGG